MLLLKSHELHVGSELDESFSIALLVLVAGAHVIV